MRTFACLELLAPVRVAAVLVRAYWNESAAIEEMKRWVARASKRLLQGVK